MTTKVDNAQRVFLVKGEDNKKVVCNLDDLQAAVTHLITKDSEPDIYHYWNGRFRYVTRKYVNSMLTADRKEPLNFK